MTKYDSKKINKYFFRHHFYIDKIIKVKFTF
jgi:hypothetical protein